jgi:hypothetical protein
MSLLRDFLVAPRTGEAAADDRARRTRRARAAAPVAPVVPAGAPPAPSLGLLAPARDLPAAAAAVGLAIRAPAPAVLVCLAAELSASASAPGVPARAAAARLVASLRARDVDACARGRLALAGLPQEQPGAAGLAGDPLAAAATRALAAAGPLPTVLAVAGRDPDVDALLAVRDAILVALPPSTEPALARLALAGAAALTPRAAPIALALDPLQRTLALAGLRAPRAIAHAVAELVA